MMHTNPSSNDGIRRGWNNLVIINYITKTVRHKLVHYIYYIYPTIIYGIWGRGAWKGLIFIRTGKVRHNVLHSIYL